MVCTAMVANFPLCVCVCVRDACYKPTTFKCVSHSNHWTMCHSFVYFSSSNVMGTHGKHLMVNFHMHFLCAPHTHARAALATSAPGLCRAFLLNALRLCATLPVEASICAILLSRYFVPTKNTTFNTHFDSFHIVLWKCVCMCDCIARTYMPCLHLLVISCTRIRHNRYCILYFYFMCHNKSSYMMLDIWHISKSYARTHTHTRTYSLAEIYYMLCVL